MNNTDKPKNYNLPHFLSYVRAITFILLLHLITQVFAQQETKPIRFSIHAGFNGGVLSNYTGPSISIHSASRTDKVIQLESMLFFDRQSGDWISSKLGLSAGLRINVLPQKNWNPSIAIMLGIGYGSESNIYGEYKDSGLFPAFCFGFSNTFYKKHMLSIGFNRVLYYCDGIYMKYGFWF